MFQLNYHTDRLLLENCRISNWDAQYQKLLDAGYWESIQENILTNGVMDYYPYGSEKRMCVIYGENNE